MTPVRPAGLPIPHPTAATPAPAEAARMAAQRAFFQAAMGQAQAPAATAQPTTPPHVQRLPDPNAEPPQRILRPGSLLDIKV